LPPGAKEAFRRAENLCEQQRFTEAVPEFKEVLRILDKHPGSAPQVVVAEVWAHLGVAMQSLDRVPEAVDSYKTAVTCDPTLHVCFANLATLHAYLQENERALDYIGKAVALDPQNSTYLQIKQHLESNSSGNDSTESGSQRDAAGESKSSSAAK